MGRFLKRKYLPLVVLTGVAAWLRFQGLAFGLPSDFHTDEHYLPFRAFEAGSNTLNPGWFGYPSLTTYLLLVLVVYHNLG